jgi:hypothetical protein
MNTAPDQFEMPSIYATGKPLKLLDPQTAHDLMNSLNIPHIYDNPTRREHRWDSGQ